jgi:hypothetical protein
MIYSQEQVAIFADGQIRRILTTTGLPGRQGTEFRPLAEFHPLPGNPRCIVIGCWDLSDPEPGEDYLVRSVALFPVSVRLDDGAIVEGSADKLRVANTTLSAFLDFIEAFDEMAPFPTLEDECELAYRRLHAALVRIDPAVIDPEIIPLGVSLVASDEEDKEACQPKETPWESWLGDVRHGYLHWRPCKAK